MKQLVDRIQSHSLGREEVRDLKRTIGARRSVKSKNYVYRFQAPERSFSLALRFRKPEVDRKELVTVLRDIIRQILEEDEVRVPAAGIERRMRAGESPN